MGQFRRVVHLIPLVVAVGVAAVLAAPVAAQVKDKVVVGVPGRNDTRGYSKQLTVDVASPSAYDAGCCTDADSGQWNGPIYAAEQKADLGGTSKISWRVVFDRHSGSAGAAAHSALIHPWPTEPALALGVPFVSKGRRVGVIPAVGWLTEEPGANSARVEGAIGFPLCRGLYAVANFSALEPFANTTNGVYGAYVIQGAVPAAWNRAAIVAAFQGVSLDGYLPPQRLTALGGSHSVSGRLTDCAGHPMPYVQVAVGADVVHTDTAGRYRAPLRPGTYTALARVGGYSIRSAGFRVR